ncbi:MAG TPA: AarF/ABC1/UbiB kinase family protein [Candidatus Thiothrix moscowensis]|uniref:ABC1 kinase family protein n=1 Tax=unclassified Thiothrix TaxID=2636184 RepID=UPI0025D382F5|nr:MULTISPECIES: AarF/ABC1/UbiB kinase family protein [unclassified Thiothrix]HRJ54413.1 AarF/ABC1/UbiB kinase family protein [Candidatus Thiothrix moscowensis]HRJ94723.1 AarF/ABC1/UbiB kinase family protein [Candidatus Thiothrix moscowensis]
MPESDPFSANNPPTTPAAIPTSRISRLAKLGTLATGVAGRMLAEGARQLVQGNRPKVSDLLLTPANAKRVADELARLRGAAMKVGQLLSMDAGDLLPPELSDILSRLRADAKPMPLSQLAKVLENNWGKNWHTHFKQFSFQPLAAASIGQVHSAHTHDGRHLALKIQYPGIRESIDSDVENVATLLRISRLIPNSVDIKPLLAEAKRQLHAEADYTLEANHLKHYRKLLAKEDAFLLPDVHDDFTTHNILAMSHVGGVPVEQLAHCPQAERDRVMTLLLDLLFREIFVFRLVQTDPNFANYRYERDSQQLVLLDFGATREYPAHVADGYWQLMQGAINNDKAMMDAATTQIGFFQENINPAHRAAVLDLFQQACEPLCQQGVYDFGTSSLAARIRDAGMVLSMEKNYWHTPPADAIFLHRKLGGLYLLAARLRAKVNVRALFPQ